MKTRLDGWANLLSKIGIRGRDKRTSWCITQPEPLNQVDLAGLYHGDDIAHRIARLPALEMTRAGIDVVIPDGDPTAVQQSLDAMRFMSKLSEAVTWARLFGGAIIFVGADDGQTPDKPLNMNNIKSVRFLSVLDRHDVHIRTFFSDPLLPDFGQPELYEVIRSQEDTLGQGDRVGGQRTIHSSRVLRLDGTKTTRRRRRERDGWSDSVFVRMFGVLRGYSGTWASVEVLMQDFAQAVIKMKGLAEAMATHGEADVMKRMELMDTSRSVLRGLLLDAEQEDFERKATPMGGIPEVLEAWQARLAAAAEIPVTLLFGMGAQGLTNTGEADRNNWFNHIDGMQEEMLRPQIERFLEILFNSADGPTSGTEPAVWSFNFASLQQLDELQTSQLRKAVAETDALYIDSFVLTPQEVANSRFGGDEYSAETQLDTEAREELESAPDAQAPNPVDPSDSRTELLPSGGAE